MATSVWLYDFFSDDALLSGGSWLAALPLANLQNEDVAKVARSTNSTTSATKIFADLGREFVVGGIAFGPTNISPGAQYRIRSFEDAAMATTLYDSGVKQVAGSVVESLDLEWEDPGMWYGLDESDQFPDLPVWVVETIAEGDEAPATARYWLVEVFDAANSAGHLDIGRLLIGRSWRPSINYSEDNLLAIDTLTDMTESLGGLRTYWHRGLRRSFRAAFPSLPQEEAFADVFRLMAKLGIHRQIFIIADPDDTANAQKRNFLATMRAPPAIHQIIYERAGTVLDVEEVL